MQKDAYSVADPGEVPPPLLLLDQTEARRVEKYLFGEQAPLSSQGLD